MFFFFVATPFSRTILILVSIFDFYRFMWATQERHSLTLRLTLFRYNRTSVSYFPTIILYGCVPCSAHLLHAWFRPAVQQCLRFTLVLWLCQCYFEDVLTPFHLCVISAERCYGVDRRHGSTHHPAAGVGLYGVLVASVG